VLVVGFPAQAFATNCYVLAVEPGAECIVVDPGVGVERALAETLCEHRLKPQAVLLTHGHGDHVASVTPVCGAYDIPAYLHGDDAYRLSDPFGPWLRELLRSQLGSAAAAWREPDDIRPLVDGLVVTVAGLEVSVDHAPGHTEGSVMFRLPSRDPAAEPGAQTCLSGDVLFAGSIGRTDLPGGDHTAMQRSLASKVLPLRDDTVVLPGHGHATTIGRERASNPYLQGLAAAHLG